MAPCILIFGTGSIGAAYAYIFSRALPISNIVTVCRSNYEAASQNGFTINSTLWGENLNVKPTVVRTVNEAAELEKTFDYVVICAKALRTSPSSAELIKPAVSPGTCIVLIQNGISIEEEYRELYPSNPILSTVVYLPATQAAPGVVLHKEMELLHVGTYPSKAPQSHKDRAKAFVDLMTQAGATAKLHDDVQFERWSKLLINASWNPICALSRSTDAHFLLSLPDSRKYVKDVMLEIASVAQAYGYSQINEELIDLQIGRALARTPPGVEPSMLADALAARNMEVEAIVGNTLRLAHRKDVNVPLLRGIYFLAAGLDSSFDREKNHS